MECVSYDDLKLGISIEDMISKMDSGRRDSDWFFDNIDRIREDHINEWVAIKDLRIIGSGDDIEELSYRLVEEGFKIPDVHFKFVVPKDIIWIL